MTAPKVIDGGRRCASCGAVWEQHTGHDFVDPPRGRNAREAARAEHAAVSASLQRESDFFREREDRA